MADLISSSKQFNESVTTIILNPESIFSCWKNLQSTWSDILVFRDKATDLENLRTVSGSRSSLAEDWVFPERGCSTWCPSAQREVQKLAMKALQGKPGFTVTGRTGCVGQSPLALAE